MIDVAHDGDHGRAPDLILRLFGHFHRLHGLFFVADVAVDAPNSRARSVASLASSVWLMVAKILRSISFFITRLGLDVELFGQLLDRDAFGDRDLAIDGRRTRSLAPLRTELPSLPSTSRLRAMPPGTRLRLVPATGFDRRRS